MKNFIYFTLIALTAASIAKADYATPEDFAKNAVTVLKKSGSYADCSLEGRDVDVAIKAISALYEGKFSTQVLLSSYNNGTSMKACIVLQAK